MYKFLSIFLAVMLGSSLAFSDTTPSYEAAIYMTPSPYALNALTDRVTSNEVSIGVLDGQTNLYAYLANFNTFTSSNVFDDVYIPVDSDLFFGTRVKFTTIDVGGEETYLQLDGTTVIDFGASAPVLDCSLGLWQISAPGTNGNDVMSYDAVTDKVTGMATLTESGTNVVWDVSEYLSATLSGYSAGTIFQITNATAGMTLTLEAITADGSGDIVWGATSGEGAFDWLGDELTQGNTNIISIFIGADGTRYATGKAR
jgi:hypothetical protein